MSLNPWLTYSAYTNKNEFLTCFRQVNLPTLGNKGDLGIIETMISILYDIIVKVS